MSIGELLALSRRNDELERQLGESQKQRNEYREFWLEDQAKVRVLLGKLEAALADFKKLNDASIEVTIERDRFKVAIGRIASGNHHSCSWADSCDCNEKIAREALK